MITISTKVIKDLDPCIDRLDNYLEHYRSFEGSLEEFFALDKISNQDKLWVSLRLLRKKQRVECACQFAESVLHIYESKYPNDLRPRKAIEAARSCINTFDVAEDAYAASASAYAVARSASAAAYAAADAAAHCAWSAANVAVAACVDKATEQQKQLQIILEVSKS